MMKRRLLLLLMLRNETAIEKSLDRDTPGFAWKRML